MRHPLLSLLLLAAACGDDRSADPAPDLASADMTLPDASPALVEDLPDLPPACPDLDAPGTTYTGQTITADQTWRAADGPHRVSATTIIEQGATITVEPCAIILISPKQSIEVRGALITQGTEEQPVSITSPEVDQPFGALKATGAGTLDLTHTRVLHGGARAVAQAMIELRGDDALPLRDALRVDHVWLFRSQTEGVSARHNAAFSADSDALSIAEPAQYPIHTTARLAGSVPPGSYTGQIAVNTDLPMIEDARWAPRGVPYHIGDYPLPPALSVGAAADDAPEVTWTIEPGAELVFAPGGSILLNARRTAASPDLDVSNGTIIAQGSAREPIVMRYVSDVAGAWRGIVFRAAPTPTSRLEHVLVKNAGGTTQANSFHCAPEGMGAFSADEDAAITLYGPPSSAFITHTTISKSAGDGINHAYSAPLLDLLPSNTFEDIAGCNQTLPRDADGRCPQQGYCPK